MKTKLILLLFIMLSINMQSQTKKAIVKKGATTAKKSVPYKTAITSSAFLGKNVEDVTNTLDQKFSELGYITTKVNENKDFTYDNTYVKTDVIYHNYREIILDKGTILITSDSDYKVLNIEFNRNGNDSLKSNEVNKLLMLFNIDNQQLIEKKGQKRVFKLGKNEFAQVNGNNDDAFIYINLLKAENYSIPVQNIIVDSLTNNSSFENFQTSIIKVLQHNNLKLLWKEKRFVLNDWKYNFINYTDKYTFNEGVTLQFEVNKYNKKSVSISTKSPITMLKLERAFDLSKWEHRYKARNSEINYYKNKRLLLESNKEENYISIGTIFNT